jgi:hypothetical protein
MTNLVDNTFTPHLTPYQLAHRWNKTTGTLRNWRCQGRGPAYLKIEGGILYPMPEILRIEEESRRAV